MLYVSKLKFGIALAISGFFLLDAITSAVSNQIGYSAVLFYFALALVPILYLSVARRRAIKRVLASTGEPTIPFVADTSSKSAQSVAPAAGRSWLPIGIPLVVGLLVASGLLAEAEPRDPNAVVPSVVGMRLDDATTELKTVGLKVESIDSSGDDRSVFKRRNWTVTRQDIEAGLRVGEKKTITLGVLKHDEIGTEPAADSTANSASIGTSTTAPSASVLSSATVTATTTVAAAPNSSTASVTISTSPVVPTHDACNLIDVEVLKAAGFAVQTESTTDIPTPGGKFTDPEEVGSWACSNAELDLALEVTLFTTPERARSDANYNTSDSQGFLTKGGLRTPFEDSMGGARIINTELGISRTTWSRGSYAMFLEVNFNSEIQGLPDYGMPAWKVQRAIDDTVKSADFGLANAW